MRIACVQTRSFGYYLEGASEMMRRIDRIASAKGIDIVVWPYGFLEDIEVKLADDVSAGFDVAAIDSLSRKCGVLRAHHVLPIVTDAGGTRLWDIYIVSAGQWSRVEDVAYTKDGGHALGLEYTFEISDISSSTSSHIRTLFYSSPTSERLQDISGYKMLVDIGATPYLEPAAQSIQDLNFGLTPSPLGSDICEANRGSFSYVAARAVGIINSHICLGGSIIGCPNQGIFGLNNLEEALLIADTKSEKSDKIALREILDTILEQESFDVRAYGSNLEVQMSQDYLASALDGTKLAHDVELYNLHDGIAAGFASYFMRNAKSSCALLLRLDSASLLCLELAVEVVGPQKVRVLVDAKDIQTKAKLTQFAKRLGIQTIDTTDEIAGYTSSLFSAQDNFKHKLIEAKLLDLADDSRSVVINCYTKTDVLLGAVAARLHMPGFAPLADVYLSSVHRLLEELDFNFPALVAANIGISELPEISAEFSSTLQGTYEDKLAQIDRELGAQTKSGAAHVHARKADGIAIAKDALYPSVAYAGDTILLMSKRGVRDVLFDERQKKCFALSKAKAPALGDLVCARLLEDDDFDFSLDGLGGLDVPHFGSIAGIAAAFTTKDGQISSTLTNINLDDNKELSALIEGLMTGENDMDDPQFMEDLNRALAGTISDVRSISDSQNDMGQGIHAAEDTNMLYSRRSGRGGYYFSEN